MKHFFLATLLVAFCLSMNAQSPIEIQYSFMSNSKYYQDGAQISVTQVTEALTKNFETYAMFKEGHQSESLGQVIGFLGGLTTGYNLGRVLASGEFSLLFAGASIGLTVIGSGIQTKGKTKKATAIGMHNDGLSSHHNYKAKSMYALSVGTTNNGVGIILSF